MAPKASSFELIQKRGRKRASPAIAEIYKTSKSMIEIRRSGVSHGDFLFCFKLVYYTYGLLIRSTFPHHAFTYDS